MIKNEKNTDFPKENASIFDQTTPSAVLIGCYDTPSPEKRRLATPSLTLLPASALSSLSSPSLHRHNINVKKLISIQYFIKLIYYYLLNYNFMKKNYKQYINVTRCKKKIMKMCENNSNKLQVVLAIIIMLLSFINLTEGGTCWLQRMENGKCNKLYTKNITREECCRAGYDVGYTDRDVSQVEAFFADAFNDGVTCIPCLQSCETATCGAGKRCVLKKDRPKCICAPICKAPKPNNNGKNKKIVPNINVINLSQSHKNFKRHNLNDLTYISSNVNSSHHHQHHHLTHSPSFSSLKLDKSIRSQNHSKAISKPNKSHQRNVNSGSSSSGSVNRKSSSKIDRVSENDDEREVIQGRNRQLFEVGDGGEGRKNQTKNTIRHRRKKNSEITKMLMQNKATGEFVGIVPHKVVKVVVARQNGTVDSDDIEHQFRSGFFEKNTGANRNLNQKPTPAKENANHGNYFNPVCGTDGKTYKTECQLKKRACRQESTTLTVAYRGHCQTSCRFVQCALGKQCVEDQYSTPHCVECLKLCPSESKHSKLVCGVDGVTYKNLCELKQQACLTGRSVQVAYKGPCNDDAHCDTIICKDRQTCLPDLLSNRPRCVSCSFKCPRWRRPQGIRADGKICGTNQHSYHSWCQMVKDSCNTGFYIDIKHDGTCRPDEMPDVSGDTTEKFIE